ncbi:MAG TPA: tRNA pseudouridine(38-40) synthase TruA [Gaiellaceae bacterium]|nr:tRNA pseudouridine(38-40) synthase TruA [Gaiellaceae bacterium]
MLKLTVAYDGTDFHGFAAQRDQRTVEGLLTDALSRVLRAPVDLACAGRTDAGVHGWGQVVSTPMPDGSDVDVDTVARSVSLQLGPEVVVRAAEVVEDGFDARHSARWRAYRYTIVNRPVPDPFLARHAWWVPEPLDLRLLRLGADPFLGEHDFASFCRHGPAGSTTLRRVLDSRWRDAGDGVLLYEIRATAFCWQMVRSIVGTLVDVGVGRLTPGDVLSILRARDRNAAGRVAPPHGLCLWDVGY